MMRKSVLAPWLQRIGPGHGDAQSREAGLAAEVAHQRNKGLDLLLGGRGRQHDRGFAQIGNAREREARVGKELQVGHGRVVRIAAADQGSESRRMEPCMLMGVVSWQPPFLSNWKVKSKESELENGRRLTTGTGTSVLHSARGFLARDQRNGTQERVVDAHLQRWRWARWEWNCSGRPSAEPRWVLRGVVIDVGRNAEIDD